MKNTLLKNRIVLALGVALWSGAAARAEMFMRPAGWHVDYRNAGFESKTGAVFGAGVALGAAKAHELGVEAGRVSWAARVPLVRLEPGASLGATGSGDIVPLLASYRFYLGAPAARWRVYAGGAAGVTKFSGDLEVALSGMRYGGSGSGWETTFGGTAGVSVRLTRAISVDAGYRYLRIDERRFETKHFVGAAGFSGSPGLSFGFGEIEAHAIAVGATVRF